METGIAPSQWEREGSRVIVTAVKILEEREQESKRGNSAPGAGGPSGPQYSG